MNKFLLRAGSAQGRLMLLCLLGAPLMGTSQIDFQETREFNGLFPDEGIIETADVDNDGDLDILVMGRTLNNGFTNSSRLLLNDGLGNFSLVPNTPFAGSYNGDADFADIDTDGDLDVIITGQEIPGEKDTGKLYINQGNAVFTISDQPFPEVDSSEVDFFYYDDDPYLDVLISGNGYTEETRRITTIYRGDGQGGFQEVPNHGLEQLFIVDTSFGDIDGDGDEDLLLSGQPLDYLLVGAKVYLRENGAFVYKERLTMVFGGDAELADFDHDGDLDYLVTGRDLVSNKIEYFTNDGTGKFSKVLNHPFITVARSPEVFTHDFDMDGDLDVFISGWSGTTPLNHLYLNNGTGGFTISDFVFPVTPSQGAGVGDFDGKGLLDFLFFGAYRQKATIYYNNIELNEPPVISNVDVTGEALVNYQLSGSYTFQDKEGGEDQSNFQWYRADDHLGTNETLIQGATLIDYLVDALDEEKFIKLKITPNDGKLSGEVVQSEWIGPVKIPVPEINVSGNSILINNGSVETSMEDNTHLGGVKRGGSISKVFTLGNNGKADLVIGEISLYGGNKEDFFLTQPEALPIVPGATSSFTLEFSPTGLGRRTTTVSIRSNDVGDPLFTFEISGDGLNSHPAFEAIPAIDIQENFVGEVFDLNASDGEGGAPDENVVYTISGGEDKDQFQIEPESGKLSFISSPDFESPADMNSDNEYLLQITVDDGEAVDNVSTQSVSIVVLNVDEFPDASCKEGISVTLGTDGTAKISPTDLDGGSSDDIGIAEMIVEPFLFNCEDIGPVVVTLTVIDNGGLSSSCTTTIIVNDEIKPTISAVESLSFKNTPGECRASIKIVPPLVLDNCGSWEAIGMRSDNLPLGEPFPIGETIITWKTDATGLGEDVLQKISVVDSEAPVILPVETIVRNSILNSCGALIDIPEPNVSDCGKVILAGERMDGQGLEELFPVGETIILWTATDGTNTALPIEQKVLVKDVEQPIIEVPQNITVISKGGNCGAVVTIIPPKVTDNCGSSIIPVGAREDGLSLSEPYPLGSSTIKWTAVDGSDNTANVVYQTVNVMEREPDDIRITGPVGPRIIGEPIEMTAEFNDENFVEATWKISDGGTLITQSIDNLFTPETRKTSHSFESLPAGVFTVSLDLKYDCGKTVSRNFEYVVIYDPNGGFVTGGGWINSPAGAMREIGKNFIEGQANFGFNAKYKSGKNETDQVEGETNFQFKAGELNFKSSSHEAMSLVVSGGFKATYKGIGAINGEEGYNFMVTVIDAEETMNYQTDLFRIKIWKEGTVIYDNNIANAAEDADPATSIGGGSIVIHKPKVNNRTYESGVVQLQEEEEINESTIVLSAYPNPMEESAIIEFSLGHPDTAKLSLFDLNGREVLRLFENKVEQGKLYKVEIFKNNLMEGIYLYRLTTGSGASDQKQLMVK